MGTSVTASTLGDLRCRVVDDASGTELSTDAAAEDGGEERSFSPTQLLAAAVASCILTLLGMVARRHGLSLADAQVRVTADVANGRGRRIRRLSSVVSLPAGEVPPGGMRARIEAAAARCPLHQSLHPDIEAPIEFHYVETGGSQIA